MKKFLFALTILAATGLNAQDSSRSIPTGKLSISGYVETYFGFDFNKPINNERPSFIYNHNRHNEINVNLAYIKLNYEQPLFRANVALAAGTYMNANYAAEPGVLKNVFEANAGIKLSRKKNLWLDAGILPSHIGFESAIGKDCWTLTRSLVAENSPYFEAGARLTYTNNNGNMAISLLALNGWQRIKRLDGNSMMSGGAQFNWKVSDQLVFNYSNFFGTDKPDSARLWRIYHNVYAIYQPLKKIGLILGLDIGSEQKAKAASKYNYWFSPVAIVRLTPSPKWALAARGEYFNDRKQVIVSTGSHNGFQTVGYSINVDYLPASHLSLRIEGKNLNSRDRIFNKDGIARYSSPSLTLALLAGF